MNEWTILDCGGKRSATPLWNCTQLTSSRESAVIAALCRRSPRWFGLAFILASLLGSIAVHAADSVEQWGMYEVTLKGPTNGNPFLDVRFAARFAQGYDSIEVPGFYDGEGNYRVRFSPEKQGAWKYETVSSAPDLSGKTGEFTATKPSAGNHGSVRVTNTFH